MHHLQYKFAQNLLLYFQSRIHLFFKNTAGGSRTHMAFAVALEERSSIHFWVSGICLATHFIVRKVIDYVNCNWLQFKHERTNARQMCSPHA